MTILPQLPRPPSPLLKSSIAPNTWVYQLSIDPSRKQATTYSSTCRHFSFRREREKKEAYTEKKLTVVYCRNSEFQPTCFILNTFMNSKIPDTFNCWDLLSIHKVRVCFRLRTYQLYILFCRPLLVSSSPDIQHPIPGLFFPPVEWTCTLNFN